MTDRDHDDRDDQEGDDDLETLAESGAVDRGGPLSGRRQDKMLYFIDQIRRSVEEQTELMREQTRLLREQADDEDNQ